jgi:hypothetical protein
LRHAGRAGQQQAGATCVKYFSIPFHKIQMGHPMLVISATNLINPEEIRDYIFIGRVGFVISTLPQLW